MCTWRAWRWGRSCWSCRTGSRQRTKWSRQSPSKIVMNNYFKQLNQISLQMKNLNVFVLINHAELYQNIFIFFLKTNQINGFVFNCMFKHISWLFRNMIKLFVLGICLSPILRVENYFLKEIYVKIYFDTKTCFFSLTCLKWCVIIVNEKFEKSF